MISREDYDFANAQALQGVNRRCGFRTNQVGHTNDTAQRLFHRQNQQCGLTTFSNTLRLLKEFSRDSNVMCLEQAFPPNADPDAVHSSMNPMPRVAVKFTQRRF